MINTKLADLYSELSKVINHAVVLEQELVFLHQAINEDMNRISLIKSQIADLEAPDQSEAVTTPVDTNISDDADELVELLKASPVVGIGWDEHNNCWRFRRKFSGKQRVIARAKTHIEIVALKKQWEQEQ